MASDDVGTEENAEQFAARFCGYMTGHLTTNLVYLGDQLGLYSALKRLGKTTSAALAGSCGLSERWVREWLFQQASAGLLQTDAPAEQFWMTAVQTDALANETGPDASEAFLAGVPQQLVGVASGLQMLKEAFKTGRGLKYDDYERGRDLTLGVSRELGVWVRHAMLDAFCGLPGLRELLESGAAVADVGCGCGEGLLTLASAFPKSSFRGYDTSAHALAEADAGREQLGVSNAAFLNPETDPMPGEATFDFVYTMDAVHDMAHPDAVLRSVRRALKPGGRYLICDFAGRASPGENIAEMPKEAAMLYGFSTMLCMSSALSQEGGMGLGTLGLTEAIARSLTAGAGFSKFRKLEDFGRPDMNYFLVEP